jgi:hypothetical protein
MSNLESLIRFRCTVKALRTCCGLTRYQAIHVQRMAGNVEGAIMLAQAYMTINLFNA